MNIHNQLFNNSGLFQLYLKKVDIMRDQFKTIKCQRKGSHLDKKINRA